MDKRPRGRPKGSLTNPHLGMNAREALQRFLKEHLPGGIVGQLKRTWDTIEAIENPAMRARLQLEFIQYFVPKQASMKVEQTITDNRPIRIQFSEQPLIPPKEEILKQPEVIEVLPTEVAYEDEVLEELEQLPLKNVQ